jgi:hypothetical protein
LGDVLALQLAMNGCPVGLEMPTMALLRPCGGEQSRLKHRIGHLLRQRPAQARSLEALKRRDYAAYCNCVTQPRDLAPMN